MEIKSQNRHLIFSESVLCILDSHKQLESFDHEKGGIILGKLVDEKIFLTKLSVPTELDKSSRTNFERHRLSGQIIINHEFYNSNKEITYLGEWHTHPEDIPTPSTTDLKMIEQQFLKNIIHTDFLILLIQGRKDLYIGIKDKHGFKQLIKSKNQ